MKYHKIHYLPKYVNPEGELVVYVKDLAELMEISERMIAITEAKLLFGIQIYGDEPIYISETISFETALLIVQEIFR
jgi:hypothetical protein